MGVSRLLTDSAEEVGEDVCFKVAADPQEREAAFRLVYASYLRAGLIRPNPWEMRITPYNLLPTTAVFVAKLKDEVICTVSLVRDSQLGLPMESIYPEELAILRMHGGVLAEVSALADRRHSMERFFPVFLRLVRVLCPYAKLQGVEQLVVAVHPRHARFYERFLKFERFGMERMYPEVCDHPAVPLRLDFLRLECRWPSVYELLFGAELTREELQPCPILDAERERLRAAVQWYARGETLPEAERDDESTSEALTAACA